MLERFTASTFVDSTGYILPYRLCLPLAYDPQKAYPIILFLHGAGERGADNESQLKLGIHHLFAQENHLIDGCVVIAPQCPEDAKWVEVAAWSDCLYSANAIPPSKPLQAAWELLQQTCRSYAIDTNRIYLTGISMGGYGTWALLARHPQEIAAAVLVCGGCDVSTAARIADIPIRTYHGLLDECVPPHGTQTMVKELRALGSDVLLTEYPDIAHGAWNAAYVDDALMPWLLAQNLANR